MSKCAQKYGQGAVTPICTVVTAKTGDKKWSTGQGVFLSMLKLW